jgi:uncharacterized protein
MMGQTPVPIVRRRVDIDFTSVPPGPWFPSQPVVEGFLSAISFFFPAGEKFFIESVQHYQGRITDPVLQDQVRRFIYQEAMHTRVHCACNRYLIATYPHGHWIERVGKLFLDFTRWVMPRAWQLAVTCAIEHFTAMLADDLLRRPGQFTERVQPAYAELWIWHALEETEHKAVCYDLYRQAVGKGPIAYLNRVLAMAVTSLVFAIAVGIGVSLINLGRRLRPAVAPEVRGPAGPPRPGQRSTAALLGSTIPWRLYFAYYTPSFHPWDHDNAHLVEEWKRRLPGLGARADDPEPGR